MDNEYTVSLTFKEWMDICQALGYTKGGYMDKDMKGQANRFQAINDKIAEQLTNYDE